MNRFGRMLFFSLIALLWSTEGRAEATPGELAESFADKVTLSGLAEVSLTEASDYDNKNSSDVTLSTVELALDAVPVEWAKGHLLFLFEEDETEPMELDEGTVTIGATESVPAFLTAGRMYLPFGVFESSMISDYLTLELGETRKSALQLGWASNGIEVSAYGFNCDVEKSGQKDDTVQCFGGSASYIYEGEETAARLASGYISSLVESGTLQDALADAGMTLAERNGGYFAFAAGQFRQLKLIGEFVSAANDLKYQDGTKTNPSAYNAELDFNFQAFNNDALIGIACQGTDDAVGLLPEHRYLASAAIALHPNVSAAVEFAYDEDYAKGDNGSGESAHTATAELALSF